MPHTKRSFYYGYTIVASAFICLAIIFGVHNSFGIFLKPLLSEFGWSRAAISGAFSIATATQGLLAIFMGWLNDRAGPRIVLSMCGFTFGFGFLLMSQINTVWQLYLVYGLIIGSGVSGVWIPLMSTVARWFKTRRGLMSGLALCGIAIGGITFPLIATQLISIYDWRISYAILGGASLLAVIPVAQLLRRGPGNARFLNHISNDTLKMELELDEGGLSLRTAMRTKQLWLFIPMVFCSGYGIFSLIIHIVPHSIEMGFSSITAASILAIVNGVSIAGRVLLGIAADKIGNKQVFILSFVLMILVFLWLVSATEVWQLYSLAVIFGIAYGGLSVAESPLVAELFGLRSHGLIYGVVNLGWIAGASVGPLLTGYIFDLTKSYQMAFPLGVAIAFLGLVLTIVLKPTGEPKAIR